MKRTEKEIEQSKDYPIGVFSAGCAYKDEQFEDERALLKEMFKVIKLGINVQGLTPTESWDKWSKFVSKAELILLKFESQQAAKGSEG